MTNDLDSHQINESDSIFGKRLTDSFVTVHNCMGHEHGSDGVPRPVGGVNPFCYRKRTLRSDE